jgi:hypothetical protein
MLSPQDNLHPFLIFSFLGIMRYDTFLQKGKRCGKEEEKEKNKGQKGF